MAAKTLTETLSGLSSDSDVTVDLGGSPFFSSSYWRLRGGARFTQRMAPRRRSGNRQ